MSIFNWSPAPGPTGAKRPNVRTAQYSDGYQQRVGNGINPIARSWQLQFTRLTEDIEAIDNFLEARAGVESFDWTPPAGIAGKWICKEWSRNVLFMNVQGLAATFEEVFGD